MSYHLIQREYDGFEDRSHIDVDHVDIVHGPLTDGLLNMRGWLIEHHGTYDTLSEAMRALTALDGYSDYRWDILAFKDGVIFRAKPGPLAKVMH